MVCLTPYCVFCQQAFRTDPLPVPLPSHNSVKRKLSSLINCKKTNKKTNIKTTKKTNKNKTKQTTGVTSLNVQYSPQLHWTLFPADFQWTFKTIVPTLNLRQTEWINGLNQYVLMFRDVCLFARAFFWLFSFGLGILLCVGEGGLFAFFFFFGLFFSFYLFK